MSRQEKPVNGREMQVIEYLAVAECELGKGERTLRERLDMIPNGWRQWRLMTVVTQKLLEQVYDTMPVKSLKHMRDICQYGEMLIRMRPAVRPPERMMVDDADMRTIINTAMEAECAICIRDAREIKACKLRRALMGIAPPNELPVNGCGYRDVAVQSEHGNYI